MYDIIFIGSNTEFGKRAFAKLKNRFPLAKSVFNDNLLQAFEEAKKKVFTKMFWVVWEDLVILPDFNFDYKVPEWDFQYTHSFLNYDTYNGVALFPKNKSFSAREISYRFFLHSKKIDIVASVNPTYDIVFISYDEPNAEENYKNLLARFPNAMRVDKIKGIHNAHKEAAKLVITNMFYVVDGDAIVEPDFKFNLKLDPSEEDIVHVWSSKNPINNLEYGYGGIKLLPTALTRDMGISSTDMTMNISSKFKVMEEVSNITAFNTDAFTTWRSAFRECCKLVTTDDEESLHRLYIWCTLSSDENAIKGALAGRDYGRKNAANLAALSLINDFDWLRDQFNQQQ